MTGWMCIRCPANACACNPGPEASETTRLLIQPSCQMKLVNASMKVADDACAALQPWSSGTRSVRDPWPEGPAKCATRRAGVNSHGTNARGGGGWGKKEIGIVARAAFRVLRSASGVHAGRRCEDYAAMARRA